MPRSKGMVIGFWIATALFSLQMGFTAYAQLRLPEADLGPGPQGLTPGTLSLIRYRALREQR